MGAVRRLFIVLASVAVVAPHPARAAAQCGFFSTDPGCARASKPGLTLDFWAHAKPTPTTSTTTKRVPTPAVPVAIARGALQAPTDCRMVKRPPNPNVDSGILKSAPADVEYTMRTIPVPPCPDK
jgi:hypothetical protein